MRISTCSRCGAEIVWGLTANGKNIPIQADSIDLFDEAAPTEVNQFGEDVPRFSKAFGHEAHFDFCGAKARPKAKRKKAAPKAKVTSWRVQSHFQTLWLLDGAPLEVIRAAYKALALLHHPDRGGSHEAMVRINTAFEALTGSEK